MTEELIKDTHVILVNGLSADKVGVISITDFAGTYRYKPAFAGSTEIIKLSQIPDAMKSMVFNSAARSCGC